MAGGRLWIDFTHFYFAINESPSESVTDFLFRIKTAWRQACETSGAHYGVSSGGHPRACLPSLWALTRLLHSARTLSVARQSSLARWFSTMWERISFSGSVPLPAASGCGFGLPAAAGLGLPAATGRGLPAASALGLPAATGRGFPAASAGLRAATGRGFPAASALEAATGLVAASGRVPVGATIDCCIPATRERQALKESCVTRFGCTALLPDLIFCIRRYFALRGGAPHSSEAWLRAAEIFCQGKMEEFFLAADLPAQPPAGSVLQYVYGGGRLTQKDIRAEASSRKAGNTTDSSPSVHTSAVIGHFLDGGLSGKAEIPLYRC